MTGLVSLLKRFRADDSGQSLVIISLSMVVFLGMAAFAIDVANWYTKHHQAQVVADSAALAAANCLAHPNVGASGSSCSSSTDVNDAKRSRSPYAAANGLTITTSQVVVDTANRKVTVNASAQTPAVFASVFGLHNTTEAATAAASWSDRRHSPAPTQDRTATSCSPTAQTPLLGRTRSTCRFRATARSAATFRPTAT